MDLDTRRGVDGTCHVGSVQLRGSNISSRIQAARSARAFWGALFEPSGDGGFDLHLYCLFALCLACEWARNCFILSLTCSRMDNARHKSLFGPVE